MKNKLAFLVLILCFGNILNSAQTTKEKPAPTGLVLEVSFYKGRPPAYIAIGQNPQTPSWAWYTAFERLPNFQTSAERPLVRAVKFIPFLEDGVIKVSVKVLSGEKSFDKEQTVASYSMRENERFSVKELNEYGVMPFEIAVVRVAPSVSGLPAVENRTKSLQVTSIEPNFSTLPTYKLSLINNSNKPVSAFTYEAMEDTRKRLSGMEQGRHGENVLEPGATFSSVMMIPLEYKQLSAERETPKPANGQTIVISSVVFADGSYEGDASRAAQFRVYTLGRKTQVRQIIELLESFENASTVFDWDKFAKQSAQLETHVSEKEFNDLMKQFPTLDDKEKINFRRAAEMATDIIKQEFIKEAAQYRDEMGSSVNSRIYLTKLKEEYQNWLARLQ